MAFQAFTNMTPHYVCLRHRRGSALTVELIELAETLKHTLVVIRHNVMPQIAAYADTSIQSLYTTIDRLGSTLRTSRITASTLTCYI